MHVIAKVLLLIPILVSCGTPEDKRYRDTAMLERPPVLATKKKPEEPHIIDNSKITKKRHETGLGPDVYMIESTPMLLKIKKPLDDAWRILESALKQSQIKIVDHREDKGLYYVYYRQKSLFENAASLFKKKDEDEHDEANYVLTVKADRDETKITANPFDATEQDSDEDVADTGAEALLWALYKTLHDDLKEE
jgi:uncharacterized lipoprotein